VLQFGRQLPSERPIVGSLGTIVVDVRGFFLIGLIATLTARTADSVGVTAGLPWPIHDILLLRVPSMMRGAAW
jgi:hypothetical protein